MSRIDVIAAWLRWVLFNYLFFWIPLMGILAVAIRLEKWWKRRRAQRQPPN